MERFIVGTGRCGSTLLSKMLAEHESVLSIFEFFTGLDWADRFGREPVDATAFTDMICADQPFVTAVLRRGYPVEEVVYPFGKGRYRRDESLPWILVAMLPRMTRDPDTLYDELRSFCRELPRRRPAEQYQALFDWLAAYVGKSSWVERSGSSIEYLACLDDSFPRARFLHLHRDGPETALSMREHHAYRLPISILYDAPVDDGTPTSQLGPIDWTAPPRPADPLSRILASRPPARYFGRYWSDQVARGIAAAKTVGPERYLELRFETLVSDPSGSLHAIADFFDLPAGSWIERAAALVRGTPNARVSDLSGSERDELLAACRPGMELLGR
jgi:hypothetical protein